MTQSGSDIGASLRSARERSGLTLRDIANTTKISTWALEAIERNDFARLPGGIFRRAYVRAFAAAVGLNADELTRAYRGAFEREVEVEPLDRRVARVDGWPAVRHVWVGALVTAVAALAYAFLPPGAGQQEREDAEQESSASASPIDAPMRTLGADAEDEPREIALAAATAVDPVEPALQLEMAPTRPCWISAIADGERVLYRLVQPGERVRVDGRSAITLRVGDAGAVAYSLNGATGRPLGRDGEATTVLITEETVERLLSEPSRAEPPRVGAARRAGLAAAT